MAAPDKVLELIERFDYNLSSYRSGKYNETQVRREFIDPLFKALGWDIDNEKNRAEAYKQVVHEDAIKIGGQTKAPDYSFRIGGTRKFFLEAKKPSVNIKDDLPPAFQVRRYAWSAKLPLSILTDFEEFAVYDCRIQPEPTDKASTARIKYLKFHEYAEQWDYLEGNFSPDAIERGSFDKYASDTKSKRGTAEVDDAFLKEIEGWRELLAQNIALRNSTLTQRELNTAVQKTIDRIIFLRICEDRGIEPYGILGEVADSKNVYTRLGSIFQRADDRYNSGLFHFKQEKSRAEEPDSFTLGLSIDDKPLKEILKGLYYPVSPYEFSVLPADILGQVYEQFLGKVIVLDAKHKATVEEKPEVKKAGGVYYTPTYIVDYIVQNTVGKLLEGKTPNQVSAQGKTPPLRVLDPACGSGSFLIGAYQHLLDWHLTWYTENDPEKYVKGRSPRLYQDKVKAWRLTTDERKRILLTHIYGVDIDVQAVEVTKLSLLLKMLEGENNDSLVTQTALFQTRVLPDLESNIKSGNSLIGSDFYDNVQINMFDEEERYRINVFDWDDEFTQVFADGGFDVVIGNPPYLYSAGKNHSSYFLEHYDFAQYQTDYYVYFIEKAFHLAKNQGVVSYIVPDSWLNSDYFSVMRRQIVTKHQISKLVVFDYPVFKKATIENSIFFAAKEAEVLPFPVIRFLKPTTAEETNNLHPKEIIEKGIIDPRYSRENDLIIQKMEAKGNPLGNFVDVNRGIHAYRTDGYGKSKFSEGHQTKKDKDEKSYHATEKLDPTYLLELKGKHVFRFTYTPPNQFLSYGEWLAEPREPRFFNSPKIALRKILGKKLSGAFIEEPAALDQSLYILISKNGVSHDLRYVMGILLSNLGAWFLKTKYSIYDTLYPWYTKKQLVSFPIVAPTEAQRILIVELVKGIESLITALADTKSPSDIKSIKKQIDIAERRLDKQVCDLYELTDEERSLFK